MELPDTATMSPRVSSDRDAVDFQRRLAAHAGIVRKVAATYVWNDADRADLMQDIVAALWQAWPRYDPRRPFPTWMYRVALNVAISHVRGETLRRRHHTTFDPEVHVVHAPVRDHEAEEQEHLLQRAMAGLESLDRALLLLHLDEMSHADIAEVLGTTAGNVATRLGRIRQRLRRAIHDIDQETP